MSVGIPSFGDVRALLHDVHEHADTWRALQSILLKLHAASPKHDELLAQIVHYIADHFARDPAWQEIERHTPEAWTHPDLELPWPELLALFNTWSLSLEPLSPARLDDHITKLAQAQQEILALDLRVSAGDAGKIMTLVHACPSLQKLECTLEDPLSLDLSDWHDSTAPSTLRHLSLTHAHLGNHGFEHLCDVPWLPRLTHLDLSWSALEPHHIASLCELPFTQLESLGLEYCNLGSEAIALLCDNERLEGLRALDLSLNSVRSECGEFLAQSVFAAQIQKLSIGFNSLTSAGIMQFCTHTYPSLRELLLESNDLGDAGIECLARAPFISQLTRLNLSFNAGVAANSWWRLCQQLEHITHLDLSYNNLTDEVVRHLPALWRERAFHKLELTRLHRDNDRTLLIELIDAISHDRLRELSLSENDLTDELVSTLTAPFPLLTELFIDENPLTHRGLAHLLELIPAHQLELLSVNLQELRDDTHFATLLDLLARQPITVLTLRVDMAPDALILECVRACAPTLESLTLEGDQSCTPAFYNALGHIDLPHLSGLSCTLPRDPEHERFRALANTPMLRRPHMHTLSWRSPEAEDQGSILALLPPDVNPHFKLTARQL